MPLLSPIGRRQPSRRVGLAMLYASLLVGAAFAAYPLLLLLAGATKSAVDFPEQRPVPRFLYDDVTLYRKYIEGLFDERLVDLQVAYDVTTPSFAAVDPPAAPDRELAAAWEEFCRTAGNQSEAYTVGYLDAPESKTMPVTLRRFVAEQSRRYGGDLPALNAALGTDFADWASLFLLPESSLTRRDQPLPEPLRQAWWEFKARQPVALRRYFSAEGYFKNVFLKAQYTRDIAQYNRTHGTHYASYAEVRLARRRPDGSPQEQADWEAFVRESLHPRWIRRDEAGIRLESIDFQFADFLRAKLGTVPAHWRMTTAQRDAQYLSFAKQRRAWRWEFVARNAQTVWAYLAQHGRGLRNTAIYCALAVVGALVINPLAAYALSRHKPRATAKVLLFLLATIALPPMVTQIPSFLMLRQFGLLNTFAALVLPSVANGYAVFLLKGFFDAVPRDLYESASLDGAGEWRTFWHITLALSMPILAVVALNTFATAYANFLFALLVCQDQSMWTLMVWLYQLQQRSGAGVVYASLVIAAVPTFLVFLFVQRAILRGMAIPTES